MCILAALASMDCLGCALFPLLIAPLKKKNATEDNNNRTNTTNQHVHTSMKSGTNDSGEAHSQIKDLHLYVTLAGMIVVSGYMSIASLKYVNFPVKVVGRCGKLIPTMIIGKLMLGKNYGMINYIAATLLCVGVSAFALGDSQTSPDYNYM